MSLYSTVIARLTALVTRTSSFVHVAVPDNPQKFPTFAATVVLKFNSAVLSQSLKDMPVSCTSKFADAGGDVGGTVG